MNAEDLSFEKWHSENKDSVMMRYCRVQGHDVQTMFWEEISALTMENEEDYLNFARDAYTEAVKLEQVAR